MHFDFPTFLVIAAVVTGGIWTIDVLLWAPKRKLQTAHAQGGTTTQLSEGTSEEEVLKEPLLVEYARSFFPVIVIVLVLRSFLVEPFRIPSGSMMPTLLVGDFILVNKFAYGIRLPVIDKKVIDVGSPKRGDVIVFRFPQDPSTDYIKRVVGLPGDRISYYHKTLYINGQPAPQQPLGNYIGSGSGAGWSGTSLRLERLCEVEHEILVRTQQGENPMCRVLMEGNFIVPSEEYFVMGDNRDNSNDSRCWGTVPEENLVGRAFMIWMNWDWASGGVAWERLGMIIE
jgi:signal peptidase I